ncbi:5,10-methylenetetrahydrofolate reductase [Leucobacter soli]|uniref:Methylenetetrahydrofolate reductase n=2 Tax=Leucobacter soli TaxID=2812850 RepID=A0A916NUJ0_9MICO|nr:methylenetetrahydrofolate reductase [Leucobacter soli]CAG7598014.1 5,10-methylenetetrahydrofolate reductase [Leucobacter soli]
MNDPSHPLLTGSASTRVRFSFEVFPARSQAAALALGHAVQHLSASGPDFISVTYGASGSNRDASLDLLKYLRNNTDALPMAHLTTVGQSRDELRTEILGMMDAGIHDFLALRGDAPRGVREDDPIVTGSLSSAELIAFIAEVRAERPPFTSVGRTSVAVYPNGHPLSRSREADIDWLVEKQEAGAQLGITQLFFEAEEYLSFVADARRAGLTMPILPGLMPVSTSAQLRRVAELAGRPAPAGLARALEAAGGTAPELGVAHTVELARELLAGGAPSIHLYTFNRHAQVLAVLRELGLLARDPLA